MVQDKYSPGFYFKAVTDVDLVGGQLCHPVSPASDPIVRNHIPYLPGIYGK